MKNTSQKLLSLLLCAITIASPLLAGTAAAQETKEEKKQKERQEKLSKKEEERREKEGKLRAKESRTYNTLKEFAEDLYASDPEFRDNVDAEYRSRQEREARYAYEIDVTRKSEWAMPETEGARLKVRRLLYDNPWIQDYVNRVGQRLVPEGSGKFYAFRVTYEPIPKSYTLSTGTVLISSGMISMLDSEAQLAYVLAHEIAHVHKDHAKVDVMMEVGQAEYNKRQERKRAKWTAIVAAAGAAVGGVAKGADGILAGAAAGYIGGAVGTRVAISDMKTSEWDEFQENEADDFALKTAIEKYYDVQEVPKLYARISEFARFDRRVELGFLGRRDRLRERKEQCEKLLEGSLKAQYADLVRSGKLLGTTGEYNLIMAELKRDNGIEAYNYDMFDMAKRNLQQAVSIRSDDALASYYYGKILNLVGRTKEDQDQAQFYLARAIKLDTRQTIPDIQLQRAMILMEQSDSANKTLALQALKDYIVSFQRKRVEEVRQDRTLPPNLETIYDHMLVLGDRIWSAPLPDYLRINLVSTDPGPAERPRTVQQQ